MVIDTHRDNLYIVLSNVANTITVITEQSIGLPGVYER